jgi:hypothetical protein
MTLSHQVHLTPRVIALCNRSQRIHTLSKFRVYLLFLCRILNTENTLRRRSHHGLPLDLLRRATIAFGFVFGGGIVKVKAALGLVHALIYIAK